MQYIAEESNNSSPKTPSQRGTYRCVIEGLNMLNVSLRMWYRRNISLRFSSNSEANASDY